MAAWLNAFLLLGEIKLLTTIAGLLAASTALVNTKVFGMLLRREW